MKLIDMTVSEFIDEIDSNSSAPGGGSVSALASSIGIALTRMMAYLSFGKNSYENLDESIRREFIDKFNKLGDLKHEINEMIDRDTESFTEYMKAIKMPKETEEQIKDRKMAIEDAKLFSIDVPLKTAKLSLEALESIDYISTYGNKNAITDMAVGILMMYAGLEGAILNVKVNLKGLNNEELKLIYTKEVKKILIEAKEIKNKIIKDIHSTLDN